MARLKPLPSKTADEIRAMSPAERAQFDADLDAWAAELKADIERRKEMRASDWAKALGALAAVVFVIIAIGVAIGAVGAAFPIIGGIIFLVGIPLIIFGRVMSRK